MSRGDRHSYRNAYFEFEKLKKFAENFPDIDQLQNEAVERGTCYVLIVPEDKTLYNIYSADYFQNLMNHNFETLNTEWIKYFTNPKALETFGFNVLISIRYIDVRPERLDKVVHTETRQVEAGYENELDSKGNPKTDTLGNQIRRMVYKNVSCEVTELRQTKYARMEGVIQYHNNTTNELLRTETIFAEHTFQHSSYQYNGDLSALSAESDNLVHNQTSFAICPTDYEIIMTVSDKLKFIIWDILNTNNSIFESQD